MDPNEALKQIRAVAEQVMGGDRDASYEMVGLFRALDVWLSNGGFSPDDWADKQNDSVAMLEDIRRFFLSVASLQSTEGRDLDVQRYRVQASAIELAIKIMTGEERMPEFRLSTV